MRNPACVPNFSVAGSDCSAAPPLITFPSELSDTATRPNRLKPIGRITILNVEHRFNSLSI
eukprot:7366944-Pyramimonas_sp.AAC.1